MLDQLRQVSVGNPGIGAGTGAAACLTASSCLPSMHRTSSLNLPNLTNLSVAVHACSLSTEVEAGVFEFEVAFSYMRSSL